MRRSSLPALAFLLTSASCSGQSGHTVGLSDVLPSAYDGGGPCPFLIDAALEGTGDAMRLVVSARNISANTLTLFPSQLPWGSHAMEIALLRGDGTLVQPIHVIDDPGPEQEMAVAAGETVRGSVKVCDSVRCDAVQPDADAALIWVYPLRSTDGGQSVCSGVVAAKGKKASGHA